MSLSWFIQWMASSAIPVMRFQPGLTLRRLEAYARRQGLALCLPGRSVDEPELSSTLAGPRYLACPDHPVTFIDVSWSRYADYVESLRCISKAMPHTVRKEMGRPERSGITLREIEDVETWGPQMFTLASEHFWRL